MKPLAHRRARPGAAAGRAWEKAAAAATYAWGEEHSGELAEDFAFGQPPRPPMLLSAHPAPGPASTPP